MFIRGIVTIYRATLRPLMGAISVEEMRQANLSVDRAEDKVLPRDAARTLAQRIGLGD